jgi:hypothetical protein
LRRPFAYFAAPIAETEYSNFGTTPRDHIILGFPRKNVQDTLGRRIHAPNPRGMSGAPVLALFEHEEATGTARWLSVVGVLVEYRRSGRDVLIATDVSHVTRAIIGMESAPSRSDH